MSEVEPCCFEVRGVGVVEGASRVFILLIPAGGGGDNTPVCWRRCRRSAVPTCRPQCCSAPNALQCMLPKSD